MNNFPKLRTDAVTQYPAGRALHFSTHTVRFLDGSEQRFREYAQPLHRWNIQLDQLDESELNRVREFFRVQNGAAGIFSFADPRDGAVFPSCSFEGDTMAESLIDVARAKTTLIVRENK